MQSLIIAFAMYSKIPMPRADWNEKNMRYAFCWFPLIGLVIGLFELIAFYGLSYVGANHFVRAVVLTVIPLAVTGGIHLDGFMDTTDARSSYGGREKKLAILKDSHVGAFAVIGCVVYLLLTVAVYSEWTAVEMQVMVVAYVLERALSGLAAVNFKGARGDGMLASFREPAKKQAVTVVLIMIALLSVAAMSIISPARGLTVAVVAFAQFAYYYHMAMREFGGTTGDLAGWFLQSCELMMAIALVVVKYFVN